MKTLIINGSPRKSGETAAMTRWIREHVEGEVKEVFTYRMDVKPCVDCRYCWKNPGCCVKDEMQELYRDLQECDNILFASPIYFSELSGSFLSVISRFQPYFCSKFYRKEPSAQKPKRGAVVVCYGGVARDTEKPFSTASMLLDLINCQEIHPLVYGDRTDEVSVMDQDVTMEGLADIAEFFNRGAGGEDV